MLTTPGPQLRLQALRIPLSLTSAAVGLVLAAAGMASAAMLAVTLAYALLYAAQFRRDAKSWLGNPLRVALPLFVAFQLAYCLWSILLSGGTLDGLNYKPESWGYPMELAPQACSEYLLLNYLLFVGIHFGYGSPRPCSARVRPLKIRSAAALWLCFLVLAVAVGGFLATYGRETNLLAGYVVSNSERLVCFAWCLLTLLALAGRWPGRASAWFLQILCMAAAIYGVLVTHMRFLVFEQIACIVVVWFSYRGLSRKLLLPAGIAGAAIIVLFTVTTNMKRSDDSGRPLEAAPAVVDALLGRAASFHADAILSNDPAMRSIFTEYRGNVEKEILSGVPFSGLLTGVSDQNEPTLDMRFAWWSFGHILETSFFVSGVTALRYTFGLPLTVILTMGSGLLLGWVSRRVIAMPLAASWILVQAATIPLALHGFHKSDFLRIVINLLLFWPLMRMVCRRGERTLDA